MLQHVHAGLASVLLVPEHLHDEKFLRGHIDAIRRRRITSYEFLTPILFISDWLARGSLNFTEEHKLLPYIIDYPNLNFLHRHYSQRSSDNCSIAAGSRVHERRYHNWDEGSCNYYNSGQLPFAMHLATMERITSLNYRKKNKTSVVWNTNQL